MPAPHRRRLAGLILVGNLSFPIMVQAGLIDQDNCEAPCGITEELTMRRQPNELAQIGSLDSRVPEGAIDEKWTNHKFNMKLVNPANKRKFEVIVVGTGLAGASAAATLGELGYKRQGVHLSRQPRRAHSIAAQGGINAAKNYQNDGDSVHRLFYDTVKGGDYRSREANVHRLAEVSVDIIDQCVGSGRAVRSRVRRAARQPLVRRRPGEPDVLRPRPDRPAAPARRLLGADAPGWRGTVELHTRTRCSTSSCTTAPAAAS